MLLKVNTGFCAPSPKTKQRKTQKPKMATMPQLA